MPPVLITVLRDELRLVKRIVASVKFASRGIFHGRCGGRPSRNGCGLTAVLHSLVFPRFQLETVLRLAQGIPMGPDLFEGCCVLIN